LEVTVSHPVPNFSAERLASLMESITETLGANPEQVSAFQSWALHVSRMTALATKGTQHELRAHVLELRQELAELQHDLTVSINATGRTQVMRLCKREWLGYMLELVEDSFPERAAA
jgi:hypothetical protein